MAKKFDFSKVVGFEWDKGNKEKNVLKHKVRNSETEEIFFNDPIIMPDRTHSVKEERYFAFGITDKKRQLIISFTLRGKNKEIIRPIISRDQNKKERTYYTDEKLKREVKRKNEKTK